MIATLLAGVLIAGLLLPYSLGLGLASNKITNALASTPSNSLDGPVPETSTITDSTGAPIAYLYQQDRTVVPLSSISENLQVAVIAVEDRRFVTHKGVDWRGTIRALLSNAQGASGQQGGSTITQQYVKNYLFLVQAKTDAERADAIATTPGRKLREAKLALTLEQHETKDDILAGYLNLVAFLPNTYGAEAAAQRLFGVNASDLTLPQAALMAGMVNNPNKFDPTNPDHVTDALKRRNIVLGLLEKDGSITAAQLARAIATPIDLANGRRAGTGCLPARNSAINGYFCQYALDYLASAGLSTDTIATGGYTIQTTLDPVKEAAAHKATTDQVPVNSANRKIANVLAVVAPGTPRKVVALAANRPYGLDPSKGQTVQKLTTTFAPLGAGSTFKIFTTAAAMQAGLGTQSVIQTPAEYFSPLVPAKPFRNNTDNAETFPTSMTLQRALATSPNTGFVKLEDQLGLAKVIDMAVSMGLKSYSLPAGEVDQAFTDSTQTYAQVLVSQKVASFTLGVTPVSPLELANVGATVASDGVWCPPTPINSVLDRNGKVVALKAAAACSYIVAGQKDVSMGLSRTLAQAMGDDVTTTEGTANQSAKAAGWNLAPGYSAGKTGTTGEYKSSAYLGFTPQFSAAALTWDYLTKPQPICMIPPNAAKTATQTPLAVTGSCSIAQATSSEGNTTSKLTGMTGGSGPAATWFDAMNIIQPNPVLLAPSVGTYAEGQPNTRVPDLSNLTIDAAKASVASAGFKFNYKIENLPTSAAANTVTRQDPPAGQSSLPGSSIDVYVSAGGTTAGG
ncbi:membrane peptidoglycan carboxypeptidase [Nakamurella sp. UYEF19]|uniref:penicillin-binding protein n=1 Tax=Nakamurella sp. UYEF19 TaxID=1756392 RepID=UPI0033943BB5